MSLRAVDGEFQREHRIHQEFDKREWMLPLTLRSRYGPRLLSHSFPPLFGGKRWLSAQARDDETRFRVEETMPGDQL